MSRWRRGVIASCGWCLGFWGDFGPWRLSGERWVLLFLWFCGALQSVGAELVEAWAFALVGRRACLRAEAGMSPRRASNFLSRRRKKVTKERATPSLRPLRVAKGQPAAGRLRGAPWNSLCAGARRSDNHGESVHEAWALRRPCSPRNRPAAGAASRGGEPNSRTATRAIAALGPACAARGACAREMGPSAAQRSNGPRLFE